MIVVALLICPPLGGVAAAVWAGIWAGLAVWIVLVTVLSGVVANRGGRRYAR